jgi:Zn-dependent protease with chaperone function
MDTDDQAVLRLAREILADAGANLAVIDIRLRGTEAGDARQSWRGEGGVITLGQRALEAPVDAFTGIVLHEYAHLIDPLGRRERALRLLAVLVGAAIIIPAFFVVPLPWAAVVLYATIAMVVTVIAWLSRRGEERADATAARLLGDRTPVVANLQRTERREQALPWSQRVMRPLTHPPARRRLERVRNVT